MGFLLSVVAGFLRRARTKDRFVVQHWRSPSPRPSNSYGNDSPEDLFYRFDDGSISTRGTANIPPRENGALATGVTGVAGVPVVKGGTSLFSEEPPSYYEVEASSRATGVVGVAGGSNPPPPSYHEMETII